MKYKIKKKDSSETRFTNRTNKKKINAVNVSPLPIETILTPLLIDSAFLCSQADMTFFAQYSEG